MGGVIDEERASRMLLLRACEPGDTRVVDEVAVRGAVEVAESILRGSSLLRGVATMRSRLPDGVQDVHAAVEGDIQAAEVCGARLVIPGDAQWPTQLDDLRSRAPLGLWVRGEANLRLLLVRSVSIVGARSATSYGEMLARSVASALADRGWLVVSGGAFGIDAAAHRGALDAGGASACVLAGGVDNAYPRSHEPLLSRMVGSGALISEAAPGAAALRQRFLLRNRLIAALTRGTVVVEAASRSGSRTTAREASSLLRPVMAFPGPVTSAMSAGCHDLLRDQEAILVTNADDVEAMLTRFDEDGSDVEGVGDSLPDVSGMPESTPSRRGAMALGDQTREGRVLAVLSPRRATPLQRLSARTGMPPTEVLVAVGLLESAGLAHRSGDGWRSTSG